MTGPNAHPLFQYLAKHTDGHLPLWNFNKYLVVDGVPVKRFEAQDNPLKIEADFVSYFHNEL